MHCSSLFLYYSSGKAQTFRETLSKAQGLVKMHLWIPQIDLVWYCTQRDMGILEYWPGLPSSLCWVQRYRKYKLLHTAEWAAIYTRGACTPFFAVSITVYESCPPSPLYKLVKTPTRVGPLAFVLFDSVKRCSTFWFMFPSLEAIFQNIPRNNFHLE
jgi:hypothetical protein